MAKTIVDEKLKYSIEINGDPAQKELIDLEKTQRKLTEANKDLRKEKERLKRENKEGTAEWKRVTQELRENNTQIKKNEVRMTELRGKIGITSLTMKQLKAEASRLRLALYNMVPGSAAYIKYEAELSKVNARMKELRTTARSTRLSIGRIADGFNRFAALGASFIATITGVVISLQKLIDMNGELADAQTNVAKTTGLTNEEVEDLTRQLGLFKTRSARIELLALAEEAGRLGKDSVADVLEFVRTADKIKVSLGDDFHGNVEETIRVIGKMTEQYKVGKDIGATFGEGMEMIGSAINEVAASGANQAEFLVDVLSRMVGLSDQAHLTADDMVGLAAVLDEAGQRSETSTTALNQVIVNMAQDTATYARIAGVEVETFAKIVDEDANEALLLFLAGLNGNNKGLTTMAKKFDGLGLDGSKAITVLSTLASQTDKIREKQALANQSMNEATSLTDEFNKKNSNFAAVLDQIQKKIRGYLLGGPLINWLKEGIIWFAKFVGAIDDTDGSVTRFRERLTFLVKVATVAATALLSYNAALKLVTMWQNRATKGTLLHTIAMKAKSAADYIAITAQGLYIISTNLLTGSITLATAAQRAWNLVIAANPIGAVVSVIAAATTAYYLFRKEQDNLTNAQRVQASIQKSVAHAIADERAELERLLGIARDETITKEKRLKAMENLRAIAPDYLKDITLEEINTLKAKKAIDNYIESLEKKARTQAMQEKRTELYKQLIDAEGSSLQDNIEWYEELTNAVLAGGNGAAFAARNLKTSVGNRNSEIEKIREQILALAELEKAMIKSGEVSLGEGDSPDDPDAARKAAELEIAAFLAKLREKETSELQKQLEAKIALAKKYGLDYSELQAELNKEIARQHPERRKAEEEIQKFLKELNQSEVDRIRQMFEEKIELAKKYGINREELEKALQHALRVQTYRELDAAAREEDQRKRDLMENSLQQLWDTERGQILQEFDFKTGTQEELNKRLYDAELAHLERMLEARRLMGEDTLALEEYITEMKLNHYSLREEADRKARMAEAVNSGWATGQQIMQAQQSAKAQMESVESAAEKQRQEARETAERERKEGKNREQVAKDLSQKLKKIDEDLAERQKEVAEDKKKAIIEAVKSQIKAYIAEAIAKFVSEQIMTQGWVGVATGIAAGAAAAALFEAVIPSYDKGKNMHLVTDQNGDRYRAQQNESLPTGVYKSPTVSFSKNMLVAEKRPEIVVDGLTTGRILQFRPDILEAIQGESRKARGFAEGNYPEAGSYPPANEAGSTVTVVDLSETNALLRAILAKKFGIGDRELRKMMELNKEFEQIEKSA